MLCEAAAAVAAPVAVVEGWFELVVDVEGGALEDGALAAAVALVAAVWLIVAPPWGETTADSLYWERPSWTVMFTRSAVIVVPNAPALPPAPATVANVDAFWNQFGPCWAYVPLPPRK